MRIPLERCLGPNTVVLTPLVTAHRRLLQRIAVTWYDDTLHRFRSHVVLAPLAPLIRIWQLTQLDVAIDASQLHDDPYSLPPS